MQPSESVYDVFGVRVAVRTADAGVQEHIETKWAAFRAGETAGVRAVFHIVPQTEPSRVQCGQQFNNSALLIIADAHKLIAASLAAYPWQIYIEAYRRDAAYVYYYLFEPMLLMVLKRCGLVHWHAAAVRRDTRAILIAGESGSGKSTACLTLVSSGAEFLADDELFLQPRDDGVYVRACERVMHVTDTTAALCGLAHSAELPLVQRGHGLKRRLAIESGAAGAGDRVSLLLFPRISAGAISSLTPLSAPEAMRRLLQQRPKEYPAVVADAPSVERQFVTCASLSDGARAFELVLGHDTKAVAQLISEAPV